MCTRSLDDIFSDYQTKYFPALLKTATVPLEDRIRIRELLRKPWNPYIFRHTSLTSKSKLINEVSLRQDAGWAGKSQMHLKYVHYYGKEASNAILKARGIISADNQQDTRLLSKPKECPNCSELNDPLGKFCIKCKMVLRYEGYAEALEATRKKEDEMRVLQENMAKMEESQLKITELLEVMKIAKSSDGKVGKDRTMLDEKRRVTIGYVDANNQSVEMKVPLDEFEIDRVATSSE